ncbi:MAG: hypothetical protein ABWY93_36195 [Mycobacterium sp.]
MGISLADLERWDPGSVRAVASAATARANRYRDTAHNQEQTIQALEWEGISRDSAVQMAQAISAEMLQHADECDQAAKRVNDAASEVESIKAEWSRIQHMADRWGIVIDSGSGMLHHSPSSDPDEQAEIEHHLDIVHQAIVDLLRKADSTDEHLASSVSNAISDMADALGTDSITSPEDAQQTVEKALAGNKDAAAQVKSVLDSITPEQRAGTAPLTPQQASVLSQMQAQQNGMSVDALASAEQNMGDSKGAMSDSWQLMSNPNINFPKTDLQPGATDNAKNMMTGGFGQLPTSVQNTLNSKGMSQLGEMTKVTNMVKDGNAALRQGTALDRGMLNKATEMMSSPDFKGRPVGAHGQVHIEDSGVATANDVLATAGGDHQAVHDILRDQAYKDNFMHGALTTGWDDDGKAAGDMFRWTGDAANGPDAKLAAETASAYGAYVGDHEQELLHMGNQTLGQVNPELVRGLSDGLTPYVPDIADLSEGTHPGFDPVNSTDEQSNGGMSTAKGIFAVLSTDEAARLQFSGEAAREIAQSQDQYARDFLSNVNVTSDNAHLADSMTLQGLVAAGNHSAVDASGINADAKNAAEYNNLKQVYDLVAGTGDVKLPGTAVASQALEEALIGSPPTATWNQHDMPDIDVSNPEHQVLNALAQNGVELKGAEPSLIAPPDANHAGSYVRSYEQYVQWCADNDVRASPNAYGQAMDKVVNATMGPRGGVNVEAQMGNMKDLYDAITNDSDPKR